MKNKSRLRVGLYLNDPRANTLRLVRCLQLWNMQYRSIWRDELADLKPGDVDVLLLHGGWYGIDRVPGQNQSDKIQHPENRRMAAAVRTFVRAGGGLVGVCAGAFNVVWLDIIPAEILRMAGAGLHSLEVADERHPIARGVIRRARGRKDRRWNPVPILRLNGPIFCPANPETMVFSYDWERRLGAVLAGGHGQGRAAAISPHPEYTPAEVSVAPNNPVAMEPPMPASAILRNALFWAAGRKPPAA